MALGHGALAGKDLRRDQREEVHHRTRGTGPDGRSVTLLLVNISAGGLMARCEAAYRPGDRIDVRLPVVGTAVAEVRWALGGRIGCQFDRTIPLADYLPMLAELTRE